METYFDPEVKGFIRYFNFPGRQPTIVFLAGLGLASTAAYPRVVFEPGLSNRHSILVDWFGCGYSDKPDDFDYTLEGYASTISKLLDYIGSKKYVLVGHSMGGAVAIALATKRPELVAQLILAEANLDAGGGLFSTEIASQNEHEFVKDGYRRLLSSRRKAALEGDFVSSVALGVWQVASPLALYRGAVSTVKGTQPIMWDQLVNLSIPRTYIFGSRSLEESEGDREMKTRLEKYSIRVAIVPGAGHGMMSDNPAGFAKVINNALKIDGHGRGNE